MKNKFVWTKQESRSLSNLYAVTFGRLEVGFIHKPKDVKNAWRAYRGIGESAVFVGHYWTKAGAKAAVEKAIRNPVAQ